MIRHYVLLATDGYTDLPTGPDLCSTDKKKVYVFGFVGGLYKVSDGKKVKYKNDKLDWTNPDNFSYLMNLTSTATIPSPLIWGEVGDRIYVTLINLGMPISDLTDLHTVHFHGGHVPTQLDGFPELSFGVPMWTDMSKEPPVATYYFNPEHPGTYMYHCHVEASEHVQMGMYGALIIYPSVMSLRKNAIYQDCNGCWKANGIYYRNIPTTATNRNFAYNSIYSYFDEDYVMLLSDIDTRWHEAVENRTTFNGTDFKPNYWLVNGRAFPDTLKTHPLTVTSPNANRELIQLDYESYIHIKNNDLVLLRTINMGYQVVPWHIHGWHFQVVGKDASPSPFLAISQLVDTMHTKMNGHDMLQMGFTATIGSGETYDLLIRAEDKRANYNNYIKNGQDALPSLCKQINDLGNDNVFDIPIDPVNCENINTTNHLEICNDKRNYYYYPQFYPMHNHDDYKVTNDGVYPGGQLTYMQIDK